jgi:hypothetical protein
MKTSIKIIHWTPRVICILSILFISLFAADAFKGNDTIWLKIGGFFMHLIPTFVLIALLIIAWKWEYIGGILFTIIGLLTAPFIFMHNYNVNHFPIENCIGIVAIINLPFIIVGILFIISHYMKKKSSSRK